MMRRESLLRNKDVLSGMLFILIAGLVFFGARHLAMGTSLRMGPGYLPLVLSGILAVLGILTIAGGIRNSSPDDAVHSFAWLRMLLVCGAGLFFVIALDGLGLPVAVFGAVFISAAASRDFRLFPSIALAVTAGVLSWILFAKLLSLPFPLLGSWLTGI